MLPALHHVPAPAFGMERIGVVDFQVEPEVAATHIVFDKGMNTHGVGQPTVCATGVKIEDVNAKCCKDHTDF